MVTPLVEERAERENIGPPKGKSENQPTQRSKYRTVVPISALFSFRTGCHHECVGKSFPVAKRHQDISQPQRGWCRGVGTMS